MRLTVKLATAAAPERVFIFLDPVAHTRTCVRVLRAWLTG